MAEVPPPVVLASVSSGRVWGAVVGGLVVFPLAGITFLRVVRLDDHIPQLFALETLTPWLYLPAYVVLVAAILLRGRTLAMVAGVLVIAHLVWVTPDMRWWPAQQPGAIAAPFTMVSANVRAGNPAMPDAAVALGRLQADVLVVLELTPPMRSVLASSGTLDRFPYRVENARADFFGSAVYSRFPLSHGTVFDLDGYPAVRADVELPGATTTVVAVHTLQPLAGLTVLRRQLADLDALARSVGARGPVILAGDFNATRQHRPFRTLLRHGLRDAHLQRGRGRARSWPTDRALVPPFALLDHVLVSHRVAVEDVGIATVPGSDHRAVTVRLAIGG